MWRPLWKKIKKAFETVGALQKAVDAIVWLGGIVLPGFVVHSSTLRSWMIGGVMLGGGLGYYLTTIRWGGRGKEACLKASLIRGIFAALALLLCAFFLALLKPDFAILSPALVSIREILLRSEFIPNLLGLVLSGATVWLVTAAITLSSPLLWRTAR